MREIKFRAWDTKTNDWIWPDNLDIHRFDDEPGFDITVPSRVVLMQFTGLKDKNGKEIYEGDIVRCASNKRCPHEVVWVQEIPSSNLGGAPGFYLKGLNEGYAFGGEEVIGNIYENKELLK